MKQSEWFNDVMFKITEEELVWTETVIKMLDKRLKRHHQNYIFLNLTTPFTVSRIFNSGQVDNRGGSLLTTRMFE